ncbi:hypothetical protein R6Q57_006334 [Mikania cordata]
MMQMGISGNKGGTDVLGVELTSGIVALTMDWDFNWSRLVFEEMKKNLRGMKKEIFQMYPRGLRPLEKFGRFGEVDVADHWNVPNVIIAEEHDIQPQMERPEDGDATSGTEIHAVDDNVVEMIDQDFDSTLNEAEVFENLTP